MAKSVGAAGHHHADRTPAAPSIFIPTPLKNQKMPSVFIPIPLDNQMPMLTPCLSELVDRFFLTRALWAWYDTVSGPVTTGGQVSNSANTLLS